MKKKLLLSPGPARGLPGLVGRLLVGPPPLRYVLPDRQRLLQLPLVDRSARRAGLLRLVEPRGRVLVRVGTC